MVLGVDTFLLSIILPILEKLFLYRSTNFVVDAKNTASAEVIVSSSNLMTVNVTLTKPTNTGFFSSLAGGVTISADQQSGFSAEIRIYYKDSDVASIDESSLRMYYYNELKGEWQIEPNSGVDTVNNYIWAVVNHFSIFSGMVPKSQDLMLSLLGDEIASLKFEDINGNKQNKTLKKINKIYNKMMKKYNNGEFEDAEEFAEDKLPHKIQKYLIEGPKKDRLLYLLSVIVDNFELLEVDD